MTGVIEEIVIVIIWPTLVPVALVAVTVGVYVPSKVGVPEITPVLVSSDKPPGSAVELKLVGLLVAVMV